MLFIAVKIFLVKYFQKSFMQSDYSFAYTSFESINNIKTLSIGKGAFENCVSLTSITIPQGVTNIGYATFYNCVSLTSITIPQGVTNIGNYAFYNCKSLTNISIPEGVTNIGSCAFFLCSSLASIIIPKSVTNIKDGAFGSCNQLKIVQYGGNQVEWEKINIDVGNKPLKNATIECGKK